MSYRLVISTVPSLRIGRKIAEALLEAKAAACVNISSGVESHYVWKKKRQRSRERMLFIKTTSTKYSRVEKVIKKNHPYDEPEIIAISISKGSSSYLKWLRSCVK